ncbi:SRPBCC family protein [Halorubellus salinus]|uniref:SRPBCC family protein n=1 Tax=Halorubellus salinus TaxID=755309 RepID=UPI001D086BAB|nr:SRPBCC family protein [Halorubellus salinus]
MTVTVERTFAFEAPAADVWAFISDPAKRAGAISVVESYDVDPDSNGTRGTWHVSLPIPVISRTAAVETRDVERRDGEYVKFVGRSKVMRVVGEHEVVPTEDGCELVNRFRVEGKLPGVERYFKKNLDGELDNLEAALRADLGLPA